MRYQPAAADAGLKSVREDLCRRYATRDFSHSHQHSAFGFVLGYHVGRPQGAQIAGCSTDIGKVQFSRKL
jgi:hypothetical protein